MSNTPIFGCEGCNTTGGRISCPIHEKFVYFYESTIYIYYQQCPYCSYLIKNNADWRDCPNCGAKLCSSENQ